MPKRSIDPETGEVALTHREKLLIDAYVANGGNGQQAAIEAGYSAARADHSASVLARLQGVDCNSAADPG